MKNLSYPARLCVLVVSFCVFMTNGHAQTYYYSKSSGSLSSLSSWGSTTTGGGTTPGSFTRTNTVWVIQNNANPTITANWAVSGSGSKVVVGNGSSAINFTIPASSKFTGNIDVTANATLTITNTNVPNLGTLDPASTVVFNASGAQNIPKVNYGNLTYSGSSTATMDQNGNIAGTFTVTNGTVVLDDQNATGYTYSINNMVVSGSGIVDFGSDNWFGVATINLTGNLTQTGSYGIWTSGAIFFGTINFVGTNQNLQVQYGENLNFTVTNGSVVTLTGSLVDYGFSFFETATITVSSGGTLDCNTNIVYGSSSTATELDLNSGGTLITANTAGINSTAITGSLQSLKPSLSSGANYIFNGSTAQISGIFLTTPTANTVNNLTINNSSGVTLSQPINVNAMLYLTNGILTTSALTVITINSGANYTGASNSNFVDGPIAEVGSTSFTFPVGVTGSGMVPIAINGSQGSSSTFQAQYFRGNAGLLGLISALGLNHVSQCDYWYLNRTAGSATVDVTGYWNGNNPCGGPYVNNLSTIALAHFDLVGSTWNKYGNDATSGTVSAGSVTWKNVSNFSPFALSSTTLTTNPLPLTLLNFNAKWQSNNTVGLTWETAQEENTDHFTIQRSPDGTNWQPIGTVAAAGTSSTTLAYSFTDTDPFATLDYYRLMMVDKDGSATYSEIKVVNRAAGGGVSVFPNPAADQVNIGFGAAAMAGIVDIRLMNAAGQMLVQKKVVDPAGQTVTIPVSTYPPGAYIVQILGSDDVQESQIVMIK